MASYTMQLKEYLEMWSQDEEKSTREIIEIGRPKLFDFEYPIFDPNYKKVFETHFIRKFYITEIGFETEELFKFQLETWLGINMPYFNKVFESELLVFEPLENSKMSITHTKTVGKEGVKKDITNGLKNATTNGLSKKTIDHNTNGSLVVDNFDRQLESTTPESRLAITSNDGEGVIEYASTINENNENNSTTSNNGTTGTTTDDTDVTVDVTDNVIVDVTDSVDTLEDFVETRHGKIGVQSYSKMLNEYRSSLLRVENTLFAEMRKELFMLVY
jgi:hypothetical protein